MAAGGAGGEAPSAAATAEAAPAANGGLFKFSVAPAAAASKEAAGGKANAQPLAFTFGGKRSSETDQQVGEVVKAAGVLGAANGAVAPRFAFGKQKRAAAAAEATQAVREGCRAAALYSLKLPAARCIRPGCGTCVSLAHCCIPCHVV